MSPFSITQVLPSKAQLKFQLILYLQTCTLYTSSHLTSFRLMCNLQPTVCPVLCLCHVLSITVWLGTYFTHVPAAQCLVGWVAGTQSKSFLGRKGHTFAEGRDECMLP